MPLPRDFLIEMARKYELSPEQEDAFVIWFSSNKTELDIATELHITNSALTTRMSHVYRKFRINGKGPGKYGRLLNFLTTEFRKSKPSDSPSSNLSEDDLNDLVQEVRSYCREMIQDQCGTIKSLTMSQPIDVDELYTNVNILEKIPSRQWREVDEMVQECNPENFARFGLGEVIDRRIPGLEAVEKYSKLMVLGKPGSGKTTFLKHLAIQCNTGRLQANHVSIFITLKQFAEAEGKPSLLEYITQMFSDCDVSLDKIAVLLKHGKTLVLLDGLDEVKVEDNSRVIKQVGDFSDKFRTNQFVITCRIAASNYTFEKFKDVEVADFDDEQINNFAQQWFKTNQTVKAKKFIQQLIKNDPIRELATNPLLLTLLCWVFEESDKFPINRSELYERGVDILIKKWDETRKIEREQVYKNLSVQGKKDLLSQIALITFERGDYFFKRKEIEQYISDYIHNLPDAQNNPEALQLDSEAVLKSIEAQHGLLVERAQNIHSFSHLTFQEYFTAKKFVERADWQNLVSHITEYRWQEVFLLAVTMMKSADELLRLMKQKIDALIALDEKLQQFLIWVSQKSCSVEVPYKPVAVRAFYMGYDLDVFRVFARDLDLNLDAQLDIVLAFKLELPPSRDLKLELKLDRNLAIELYLDCALGLSVVRTHAFYLALDLAVDVAPELAQALEELKGQLLGLNSDTEIKEILKQWEEKKGQAWTEQLRAVMIKHRNIGHDWQFSEHQKELLEQYYDANNLLVDCLNSDCEVSPEIRQKIEDTLLLPMCKIKE